MESTSGAALLFGRAYLRRGVETTSEREKRKRDAQVRSQSTHQRPTKAIVVRKGSNCCRMDPNRGNGRGANADSLF